MAALAWRSNFPVSSSISRLHIAVGRLRYPSAMSKYASLLFSPEEYYEIGPFRFPIYHDLVPGEARGIEVLARKQSKHTFSSIKLAQKIAKDRRITTQEAIELLGNNDEQNQDIFYEYASELEELQQLSVGAVEQKIEYATLFMKFRGEVKLPKAREYTKVSDWTDQDTESIPNKLLDKINQFISWEQSGWPVQEGNDQAGTEETPPQKNS